MNTLWVAWCTYILWKLYYTIIFHLNFFLNQCIPSRAIPAQFCSVRLCLGDGKTQWRAESGEAGNRPKAAQWSWADEFWVKVAGHMVKQQELPHSPLLLLTLPLLRTRHNAACSPSLCYIYSENSLARWKIFDEC